MLAYLALSQKVEHSTHAALVTCIYGQSVIFDEMVKDVVLGDNIATMVTARGVRVSFTNVVCKVVYE